MSLYVAKRLLQLIPTIFGIVLICFILLQLTGDPLDVLMHERATEQERAAKRAQLGLDRPWYLQLGSYFIFDFGKSYSGDHRPVFTIVAEAAIVTSKLALGAILLATFLGLIFGIISAYKPNTLLDYLSAAGSSIGISIPAFWLAMLFILVFAVMLEWVPMPSSRSSDLRFLAIPVLTLGLISTALIARLSRSCMLEALTQDYIRTAEAKGLSRFKALLAHAFPNALVPILTVIGTNLSGLLTGAVLTETVCALPGLGSTMFAAIQMRDHPVIMGGCLFFALIFVSVNLCVDLLYGFLDPRIGQDA